MALSPEEQEQLEEIKSWWAANALPLLLIGGLAVGGLGSYWGWNYWQTEQATGAAQLYQRHEGHVAGELLQEAHDVAAQLRRDYGSTAYASMASLISARFLMEAEDAEEAKRLLGWVRDNGEEAFFRPVATLRLARLHAATGEWEQGLAILEDMETPGYEGLVHELRGDLHRQAGHFEEARLEYIKALEHDRESEFLSLKLADLGGEGGS